MALSNFSGSGGPTSGGTPPGPQSVSGSQSPLSFAGDPVDMLIDYNAKFAAATPILFREQVIRQLEAILIGKNKPNALLVGPAGVGKTAIVEELARRIAANDPTLPHRLVGMRVYELPLSNVVAGSSYVGQLEEKLKSVIDFASDPKQKVILFIDEIHMLVGESQVYDKIGQMLKPALARGDIKVIGATTVQEASNLVDDPALNRRFSRVIVDEFTREQTLTILENARGGLMAHYGHKVTVPDAVLPAIVDVADQYHAAGAHRPDNALTLMDRACGDAIVARKVAEEEAKNDPVLKASLTAVPIVPVTENILKRTALRLMTGNAQKNDFDVADLRADLSVIRGQDGPIDELVDLIRRNDLDLFPKTVPLTVLLAGASGVGKTEVTKIIARRLTGVDPIILNMTEYHSPASINRIIGAPAGYVGSDSKAELPFDCLDSNPYQVILLDEFEKADKAVQRLFMSAFDEGSIKTSRNKIVDFSRAIIIATTNAGHTTGKSSRIGFGDGPSNVRAATVKTLAQWFDPELLNRFQSIVTFNGIDKDAYRQIVADCYARETARILAGNRRVALPAAIPDDELDAIVEETYVPEFGARPAGRAVRKFIETHA